MKTLPRVILLIETSRSYGRELLHGIARYSRLHGPRTFYHESRDLKSAIPKIKTWNANGIITRTTPEYQKLLSLGIPVVFVLHYYDPEFPENIPLLVAENIKVGEMAAEHLRDRGLRHYAYCGFDEFIWSNDRYEGFTSLLSEYGYSVSRYQNPDMYEYKNWDKEIQSIAEWIKKLSKPVGIMACNDDRGQHVIEACKLAGFSVPDEVSVIGVDNDTLACDLCDPPLTSVALNVENGGYLAAELLDRLIAGEPMNGQRIVISPTHIVSRLSTDTVSVDDRQVARAIRYIRQNARENICVMDVVEATSLSRRNLEMRFRKILNRSILKEIRRVRADLIVNLLMETDLSVAEIAYSLHFSDIEHIARYFRKEKGVSLQQYRKIHRVR